MRKLTHFRCRRLTSLAMFAASILLASLGGCSPAQPPSMAGGAPLVSWDHLKTERWRYQLSSESEIAEYRFETNGTVACTIGKKDIIDPVYGNEPMNTVYGVVAKW
ncbi:hypothetical protein [Aporhodopirellula aestuarii]|uniref:Uncharacterized protein n=1 Tax=Aporhodopirellula aestuarii TaxID=2950107 RepID=A0ABT0UDL0_9BACT|nr:hypothetical protein [Aporhodopirellula aestuarii]MCM2374468.1 hypothetical protein [Aporhodopirellula aestuarii]